VPRKLPKNEKYIKFNRTIKLDIIDKRRRTAPENTEIWFDEGQIEKIRILSETETHLSVKFLHWNQKFVWFCKELPKECFDENDRGF